MDPEAAAIRAAVRRELFGDEGPARIGRFDVLRPLGRGGMGVVYEAYDAQLDRRIAVKVLRPPGLVDADPRRAERLLREAQAIAKLSHPNVVAVHEVGALDDALYMAMELVEGRTLRKWLEAQSRSWRAIVEVFVQAGRGLSAAHTAGLVHRDFKPDNVMIEPSGRVRVLDFGLARLAGVEPSVDHDTLAGESEPHHKRAADSGSASSDQLTATGLVLGTPAYMAPEQRRSPAALPASDQYGFCVTLHEALYGVRPSPPDTPAAMQSRQRAASGVPAPVRRIIDRGLAEAPADRFPSMATLVAALERTLQRSRWPWLATAAGLSAAVTAAALAIPASADDPCPSADARVAQVWNPERRARLAAQLSAHDRAFAADASPKIVEALDARMQRWANTADDSCRATRIQATQTEDIRLWRSLCLDAQLRRVDVLLEVLEQADATATAHAVATLAELDDVDRCDAARAGTTPIVAPRNAESLAALHRLERSLGEARALGDRGDYVEGAERADEVATAALAVDMPPLAAKAYRLQADLLMEAGTPAPAETALRSAIEHAVAGADDRGAAAAWVSLVHVVSEELGRIEDARRMFAMVDGALQRAGSPADLHWRWLMTRAQVHDVAGELDEAVPLLREALRVVTEDRGEDHPRVATVLHALARALQHRGQSQQSLAMARRAELIAMQHYGPNHPQVATHLTSIGSAHGALGEHAAALEAFERALTLLRDALGSEHARVGAAHNNLGSTYMLTRQPERALPHFERAVAIDRATLGPSHPQRAPALYGLAMVHLHLDDATQAEPLLTEALDVVERAWGPEHPDLAYLVAALAEIDAHAGRAQQALEGYRRVLALLTQGLGPSHPRLLAAYLGIAQAHRAQAEPGAAEAGLAALRAAMAIVEGGQAEPMEAAEVRFELARALQQTGRPDALARAQTLARAAHRTFETAGPSFAPRAERIEAWIDANL